MSSYDMQEVEKRDSDCCFDYQAKKKPDMNVAMYWG
jgi:hypothetical protein